MWTFVIYFIIGAISGFAIITLVERIIGNIAKGKDEAKEVTFPSHLYKKKRRVEVDDSGTITNMVYIDYMNQPITAKLKIVDILNDSQVKVLYLEVLNERDDNGRYLDKLNSKFNCVKISDVKWAPKDELTDINLNKEDFFKLIETNKLNIGERDIVLDDKITTLTILDYIASR